MKKALVISPIPSHPQNQGNRRRVYDICQLLKSRDISVHFIWYAHEWGGIISDKNYAEMLKSWDQVHVVPINPKRQNYKVVDECSSIDSIWYQGISDMIKWCSLNHDYDMAIANYAVYSKALLEFKNTKTVTILDTHDVLTDRHLLLSDQGVKKQFYSTTAKEERKAINRADIVVAIQDIEAAHFKSLGHKNVLTISHLNSENNLIKPHANSTTAGFIGSNTNINIESCKRLISAIEKHQEHLPEKFTLIIAGAMCKGIDWPIPNFVKLIGIVDDLNEFYDQLDLVLVPIEFGSGLKIKTVEALSYGLPVLATQHAFIGIPSEYPEHDYENVDDLGCELGAIVSDEKKLTNLRDHTDIVFKGYYELVQAQYAQLFNLVDSLSREKRELTLAYNSGKIIKDYGHIYIYGGGAGCQLLLAKMSPVERKKIKGIIDKYKTGVGYYDIPMMHLEEVPVEIRNNCLVVLSLTSTEQYEVNNHLKKIGFSKIVNAFAFIAKELFIK